MKKQTAQILRFARKEGGYTLLTSEVRDLSSALDFATFCAPLSGGEALMRNFNSQEGVFKPILRIKITPEALSILK